MMNGWLKVFTLGILFLFAMVVSCSKSVTHTPNPDAGKLLLELKVTPEDAVIIVDDVLMGNVFNFPFLKLEPGLHKIEIRKEGYEPFHTIVEAGTTTELKVNLKKRE